MRCTEGVRSPPKIGNIHQCRGAYAHVWLTKRILATSSTCTSPKKSSELHIYFHPPTLMPIFEHTLTLKILPEPHQHQCLNPLYMAIELHGPLSPYISIPACNHVTVYSPGPPCTELSYHTFPYISIYMFNSINPSTASCSAISYSITSSQTQLSRIGRL
jgi:hypothetical protein